MASEVLFIGAAVAATAILGTINPYIAWVPALAMGAAHAVQRNIRINWSYLLIFYLGVLMFVPTDIYRLPINLPFNLQVDRLVFFGIAALWMIALLIHPGTRLTVSRAGPALLAFFLVALFSQVLNLPGHDGVWLSTAVKRLIYLASVIMAYFFIVSVFRRAGIELVLKWLTVFGGLVAVFGIIERLSGFNLFQTLHSFIPGLTLTVHDLGSRSIYRGGLRIVGSSEHPIALSAVLAMLIPLAVHYCMSARKTGERLLFYVAAAVMLMALVMTGSRSGIIMLLATLTVWLVFRRDDVFRFLPHLLLFAGLIYLIEPAGLTALYDWFFPKQGLLSEGSVNARLVDYPLVKRWFLQAPLLGTGFDMFDPRTYFFIDNQYLKFAVEIGTLGLAALFWVLASFTYAHGRGVAATSGPHQRLLTALLSSIVAFAVVSAFFDSFGFQQARSLLFILGALGVKLAAELEDEASSKQEPQGEGLVSSG